VKVRTGFVSNSSSSSFVLETKNDHRTTWDVAKVMLQQRTADAIEWWGEENEFSKLVVEQRIREIDNLNLPIDTPFTMHSTNYETYIFKYDGKILIDTCNNEHWNYSDFGEHVEYNSVEQRKYHDGDSLTIKYDDVFFFHMDYLIVARNANWSKEEEYKKSHSNCVNHYAHLQLPDGTVICPDCNPPIPITPFKIEVKSVVNRLEQVD